MTKFIRSLTFSSMLVLVLAACNLNTTSLTQKPLIVIQPTSSISQSGKINLTVQADPSVAFNAVGQIIKYTYTITNTGSTSLPGTIAVTGATVTCPDVKTVGNKDSSLDANETVVCTSSYSLTQADLNKGSVTNVVTATVSGINSNQVTTTVATVQNVTLILTKTANPVIYDRVGQTITYTYVIKNNGSVTLGPAQFTVSDTGISTPIKCGNADTSLAITATVTCSSAYVITQADLNAPSVTTTATASGGGAGTSPPVSATITKSAIVQSNPNLVAGSTIKHQVAPGEWLWQIARCYGADPNKVMAANQPNPGQIAPNTSVTVPNIGSAGKIYGPPCVGTYTVQSGDTWNSIALKYNADPAILKMVNSNTFTVGSALKVPLNSAGGAKTSDGLTGYCVDVTRTLKLTGVPAGTTHFNICGGTDLNAPANMKIGTINIYQRPEDVGLGGLSQNINVLSDTSIQTSTPLNDPNSLIVGDMNYDGNDDFRIVINLPAGPNIPYLYYLYDPVTRKFVYNKAYENITSPEFPGNSTIRSQWRESAAKFGIDTYTIANNIPTLTRRETWEALNGTPQAIHRITIFNSNGTSQIILDEIVPMP